MHHSQKSIQEQLEPLLSPAQLFLHAPDSQLINDFSLPDQKISQDAPSKPAQDIAKTSARDEKKRIAGVRSREKKKLYVEGLQQNVKKLQVEIESCEAEISKCKDQLLLSIQTSNQYSNQHAFTFAELQKHTRDEDPDIDRINLLLDIIQTRIGANARERQANLDYSFKQMINSMFPAIHRYLMHSATYKYDIFNSKTTAQALYSDKNKSWTKQLFSKLHLTEQQLEFIRQKGLRMVEMRKESVQFIRRLKGSKQEMKEQQQIFEQKISQFRQQLTAVQSGRITVFGQKNKMRQQFSLGEQFEGETARKKIKLE